MEIINFNCKSNYFTSLTCSLLKLDNHIFIDLNDLEDNIDKVKKNMIVLIYKNFSFTNDFVENLVQIQNLNKNCIISSININTDQSIKKKNEIIDYKPVQDSEHIREKKILGCLVKKNDLIKLLKNKEIKTFFSLTEKINYEKICLFNCLTKISFINNVINENDNLFCKNFKNKANIKNIENIKGSYFSFLSNNKINETYSNQIVKIYNEINKFSLNCCVIDGSVSDIEEILLEYSKSPINLKYNTLYLMNYRNRKKNLHKYNIISKVIYLDNSFQTNYGRIFENTNLNYDFYFINSCKKMKNIHYNEKINLIYTENIGFELFKIKCYILKFLLIKFTDLNDFLKKTANIVGYYFKHHLFLKNDPVNLKYEFKYEKFMPNLSLIDILYEKNEYDECCFLINFVILNKLSFNFTFIYKTLVLLDKVNFVIDKKEINSLLSVLKIDNFNDFFNIVVVLQHNNNSDLAYREFNKYILENKIEEDNILKIVLLCKWFDIFDKEIDISYDKLVINNILNHFEYINQNIHLIQKYEENIDINNLKVKIFIYLNNRIELISNENQKRKISEKIHNLTFDFNNIDKYEEKFILDKFIKFPILVINGCYQLSDFMMSENDILVNRNSLLKLTGIILKNFDKLEHVFLKLIKENENIHLVNLFRYAYHGLANKELFTNCVTLTRKFLKLKFINSNKDYKEIEKNEECNPFYFKPKVCNKKKICFISNFLTRRHSVFKDRHKVIVNLIKKDFDVHVATFEEFNFDFSQIFYGVKHILLKNMELYKVINKLRSYNFDKLIFCEIGMDSRIVNLAHFRCANKQYNTWGHSDTSGFQEIDYFVSSELYELPYEESKLHYSEKLILQKGMCTCYVNPTAKYKLNLTRKFYGLSDYEKIILCPQSLFKIHPNFDDYLFEILLQNPNSSIVLIDNKRKTKMYERWDQVLKDKPKYYGVLSRVKFIPPQNHQNFCNLMKCADILIDPYPFGGCNSSLESFSLFKPLVTQPSIRINGRFTYGFYKKMGIEEMIAYNIDEYVNITTRLLKDQEFYDKQVKLLREKSDILFEDQETLKEWEELMSE